MSFGKSTRKEGEHVAECIDDEYDGGESDLSTDPILDSYVDW